jgi:hypothetical protein
MTDFATVVKYPEVIPDKEVIEFTNLPKKEKVQLNLRVSQEAIEIIEEAAKAIGTKKANALEAIVRYYRERELKKKSR